MRWLDSVGEVVVEEEADDAAGAGSGGMPGSPTVQRAPELGVFNLVTPMQPGKGDLLGSLQSRGSSEPPIILVAEYMARDKFCKWSTISVCRRQSSSCLDIMFTEALRLFESLWKTFHVFITRWRSGSRSVRLDFDVKSEPEHRSGLLWMSCAATSSQRGDKWGVRPSDLSYALY